MIDATATPTGMHATARIARTRDGDEALVLAAPPDQVLGMFSVGVDPTDWTYDQAGTMHVHAADWHELSLLTMGAFSDARVATVTAAQPEEPMDLTRPSPSSTPSPSTPTTSPRRPRRRRRRRDDAAELVPVQAAAPPPSRCRCAPAPVAVRSGSTCVAWRRSSAAGFDQAGRRASASRPR